MCITLEESSSSFLSEEEIEIGESIRGEIPSCLTFERREKDGSISFIGYKHRSEARSKSRNLEPIFPLVFQTNPENSLEYFTDVCG